MPFKRLRFSRLLPWLVLALAAALRLLWLDFKPAHFDEGVNGWWVDQIQRHGFYHYDPTNYHGPLHFYALFLSEQLFGRNLYALRLPGVLASLGAVAFLLWEMPRLLPRRACLLAALASGVSPAFTYFARHAIHESWLLLFMVMAFGGALGLGWLGRPVRGLRRRRDVWWLTMGITGMILTKETYAVHLVCAGLAGVCAWFWARLLDEPESPAKPAESDFGRGDVFRAVGVGVALILFFYSSCGWQPEELSALWRTFSKWVVTGSTDKGHKKDWSYWFGLMGQYEWVALAGVAAGLRWLRWGADRGVRWLAIYGWGTLAAYSVIPYKTPWCIISIIWPFPLLAALAADEAWRVWKPRGPARVRREDLSDDSGAASHLVEPVPDPLAVEARPTSTEEESAGASCKSLTEARKLGPSAAAWWLGSTALSLFLALAVCDLRGAARLNFRHPADEREPYVYVQTFDTLANFTEPVLEAGRVLPAGKDMNGWIVGDSSYPIPWLLGEFPRVGYYRKGRALPDERPDFVLVTEDRLNEVEARLTEPYFRELIPVRPGFPTAFAFLRAAVFARFVDDREAEFEPGMPLKEGPKPTQAPAGEPAAEESPDDDDDSE